MVNKVILVGNLGADPELKYTGSGMAIGTLNVATTSFRKDADGNKAEETEWHRVVTFSAVAENCGKFLKKGSKVYVEGKLKTRKWQDQNGNDKYTTEVLADEVKFLSGKND